MASAAQFETSHDRRSVTHGDENNTGECSCHEEIGRLGYWCELEFETGWIRMQESPISA
jgi:hypothetical protein